MVCYVVPLVAAVITSVLWGIQKRGPSGWWLNLLLYGGAIFGFVDHLWNGELLLLQGLTSDLMLGATITATIFAGWGITLGVARVKPDLARRMGYRFGIVRQN